jgi:hypothetical protein
MTTTTSYGNFCRRINDGGGTMTLHDYVEAALGNHPDSDVDAVANDFRAAINIALPDSVQLCGDEFYGPAGHEVVDFEADGYPVDEDGALDIGAIIEPIDFWAIVDRHDSDEVTIYAQRMTRFAEIVKYAGRSNITLEQAVIELINTGLSHQ